MTHVGCNLIPLQNVPAPIVHAGRANKGGMAPKDASYHLRMDRNVLAAQLEDADKTIVERQLEIEQEIAALAELERNGLNTETARDKLERLELALVLYRQHRQRLADELGKTG